MALLKMVQVAAAAAMIAGVSVPAFAQQAPQTVEAVVAGCSGGGDCAALVASFLSSIPVAQRVAVVASLGAQLAAAARTASPAAKTNIAAGLSQAASLSPDAGQRTLLADIASTLGAPGELDDDVAASES